MPFPFSGKKADIEVTLDRTAYEPGDAVRARAVIKGAKNLKINGGYIRLVCENLHMAETTDSDGDTTRTVKRESTTISEQAVMDAGQVRAGDEWVHEATFSLPSDCPPSTTGKKTGITWKVVALLDVPHARDPHGETTFNVLALPGRLSGLTDASTACDSPHECLIDIDVSPREVGPGDRVSGTVIVTPKKDLDAKEVRIELVRREIGTDRTSDCEVVDRAPVASRGTLAGEQRYSFAFTLPTDAAPSLTTPVSSIDWMVQCTVSRRLRGDYHGSKRIAVHSGRRAEAGVPA